VALRERNRGKNAPKSLTAAGRELWLATQRHLRDQGTWRDCDAPLLEQYVHGVLTAALAREEIERSGPTSSTADGRPMAHPLIKVARDAEADARAVAADLLLTPASRRRAGVDVVPDAPPDWMPGVG